MMFKNLIVALGFTLLSSGFFASSADADDGVVTKASPYSVTETLDRLTTVLKAKGLTIFARVDHAGGAEKVGIVLPATQLLIFGNPKTGTPLMLSNRQIALDLPLKALAWQDADGKVWLAYTAPNTLKKRHAITDRDALFGKITQALDKLTDAALKAH